MKHLNLPLRRVPAVAAFLATHVGLLVLGGVSVFALDPVLSEVSPHPGNSQTNTAASGVHVFLLRKSSQSGVQDTIALGIYGQSIARGDKITFSPSANTGVANVCSTGDASATGFDIDKFISVTIDATDNGGAKVIYYISRDRACDTKSTNNNPGVDGNNAFYASYKLPDLGAKDSKTDRYKAKITVAYDPGVPKPTTKGGEDILQQRVVVKAERGKIGPLGDGARSFPIVVDWNQRDDYWIARTEIPFGLPCTNTAGATSQKVGVYDADNGNTLGFYPRAVQYSVYKKNNSGNWVQVNLYSPNGNTTISSETATPNDGSSDLSSVRIDMEAKTKYKLVITGIAPRNTIDVIVPNDTIYGDIICNWEMKPESTTSTPVVRPGDPVRWTHTVRNIGDFKTDPTQITSTVRWGKTGKNTSGSVVATDLNRIYTATGTTNSSYTFPDAIPPFIIPMSASNGDQYCQYVRANKHSTTDSNFIDSNPACVTVFVPNITTPEALVGIAPVVNPNSIEIEPTETATFNGSVNVTNFPTATIGGWGFNQYSKKLDPLRVTAAMTDNGISAADSRTVYTCPSGYSPTGTYTSPPTCSKTVPGTTSYYCPHGVDVTQTSNCKHFYNGTGNDTKTKCEGNGHVWSSGSCYDTHPKSSTTSPSTTVYTSPNSSTQYRYRCEDPNAGAWGAWNGGPPTSCKKLYQCPGGALITGTAVSSGWYYSAPSCDGWKCRYPSSQINQPNAPTCDFRCNYGIGAIAVNGNGGASSPCYERPSFTLKCQWSGGAVYSQTVTSSSPSSSSISNICSSSTSGDGLVIGTDVCVTLTAYNPGITAGSPWSASVQPGYGSTDNGATYRQIQTWGWANQISWSSSGCTEVVGRPTFKVFGGDITTGQAFAAGGSCSGPSPAASIAGWPRSNGGTYEASYTQLGAFASGSITGVATGKLRAGNESPPRGLAFANFPASGGDRYGGSFTKPYCIADHHGNAASPLAPLPTLNSLSSSTPSGNYSTTGGRLNNNLTLANGQRLTIYATGNVTIGGNGITYAGRSTWLTPNDIAGFKLVVYGGDIYIENSVTELNGVFIAQPNGSTGGNIYTCARNGAPYPADNRQLYASCQNRLTVNGAFVAKKVHLTRTQGTALRGETAEVFNYLPETWMTPWPVNSNSASQLKYDAMLSLPPVL